MKKKTEPENTQEYLCGHEESAQFVMKILCKACGLFMQFSLFQHSVPADHPRSCGHHLRKSAGARSGNIFYISRPAGMTMTSKAKFLCLMSRPKNNFTINPIGNWSL